MEHGKKLGPLWERAEDDWEPSAVEWKLSPFPSEEAIAAWTADVSSPLFDEADAPTS
ncbi:MAG: hypothetical protein H8E94_00475 [Alphaproteobacteria bacterium]|nr:hypothetical protein [Alphaproteobacteria bacterium]